MIESLWNNLARSCQNVNARLKGFQPRFWIVLIVVLVVGNRGLRSLAHEYIGHRDEIAKAIGSIGFFYGTPLPDDTGSNVLFLQSSQNGISLFRCEVATGLKEEVYTKRTADYIDCVSPFSPDRALFAWVFNSAIRSSGYISICNTDSGSEIGRIEAPSWHISEIVWLTPAKLVCRGWVSGGSTFYLIQKDPHGLWGSHNCGLTVSNFSNLTVLSSNTFAWLEDNSIRTFNVDSKTTAALFVSKDQKITEFSYSQKTGRFLVTRKGKTDYTLWLLRLRAGAQNHFTRLASDEDIREARWINGGNGYAYLNQKILVMKPGVDSQPVRLTHAAVDRFVTTLDGRRLFFVGTAGNEPWAGLWRYDMASQSMANVAPWSTLPSPYATRSEPVACTAIVATNQHVNYYIYWPAHFNNHKKYPLLIGDTPFLAPNALYQRSVGGPNWAEATAACGAYVVIVNRKSWFGGIQNCERDILSVYDQLISDPTIDAGRVFLYATSAETTYVSELVEQKPQLWKGVLFLNPIDLPDLSALNSNERHPKIFLNAGVKENEERRFLQYQREACALGTDVEVQEVPDAGHFLISIRSVCARTHAVVDFIFND